MEYHHHQIPEHEREHRTHDQEMPQPETFSSMTGLGAGCALCSFGRRASNLLAPGAQSGIVHRVVNVWIAL
jgi:hypothetical protein